jgi:hypothetical protein
VPEKDSTGSPPIEIILNVQKGFCRWQLKIQSCATPITKCAPVSQHHDGNLVSPSQSSMGTKYEELGQNKLHSSSNVGQQQAALPVKCDSSNMTSPLGYNAIAMSVTKRLPSCTAVEFFPASNQCEQVS